MPNEVFGNALFPVSGVGVEVCKPTTSKENTRGLFVCKEGPWPSIVLYHTVKGMQDAITVGMLCCACSVNNNSLGELQIHSYSFTHARWSGKGVN